MSDHIRVMSLHGHLVCLSVSYNFQMSNTLLLDCWWSGLIQDLFPESKELGSNQRFSHEVSKHGISRTVLNLYFTSFNQVCNVEVLDVEVPGGSLACTGSAILFQLHRTGVISVDKVLDFETLCFNKSFTHWILDRTSSKPTSSASVELLVLTFCLVDTEQIIP